MKAKCFFLFAYFFVCLIFFSCTKTEELTLAQIEEITKDGNSSLIKKTVSKPWKNQEIKPGKLGGVWYDSILSDPKTFNQLIAERDASSSSLIGLTLDYLVDYDAYTKEWKPHCASFEIEIDKKNDTLTVHYTLRPDLFWSYYGKNEKIPVTSDDFVFWYNEIASDPESGSSSYGSQWCVMPDGSEKRIECVKIDEKRFDFIFPRIVADPLLATNMSLCPSFIYKKAKDSGGMSAVKSLFSADTDVALIPSCGKWYITEYKSARQLVCVRNPNYWEKDKTGVSIPYYEKMVFNIVGDMNTDYLLFKQGKLESYTPRPEELSSVVENQKDDYTVFSAEGSMGAALWSFNQNPKNSGKKFYRWFTNKKFRQAMSCLLNRDRIVSQTYRGLAEPKYSFFPEANPFYDENITLQYRYAPERAMGLLKSVGFYLDSSGAMCDASGVPVEFDITIPSANTLFNDISQIIADECSKVGIKVNVRQLDFQKVVESLTSDYDWQSVMIGLGANLFPSQGSNVWPSYGNLHLWNPLQESPATEWEARCDFLYNEGCYTSDYNSAKKIWDEYQRLILEECPIIYLVRSKSFYAIKNKWNLENFYYDNVNGIKNEWLFLSEE